MGKLNVRELIKLLTADGWKFKNQEGSHMYYVHTTKNNKITVPNHKGDLKKGTANQILKDAGLK